MRDTRELSTTTLGRRTFLTGTLAAAAVLGAGQQVAEAQTETQTGATCTDRCETMTVWRLDADWGYPRGPHGKTKLTSKASRTAAANRWALTEQDALDMNLHLCSWAPAIAVQVNKCAFMEIWDHNGSGAYTWHNPWKDIDVRIFDERCLPHIDNSDVLWAEALTPCTATSTETTATSTNSTPVFPLISSAIASTTASDAGTNNSSTSDRATREEPTGPLAFVDDGSTSLAFTGVESRMLAGAGVAMTTVGAGLVIWSRRRAQVAEAEAAEHESSATPH